MEIHTGSKSHWVEAVLKIAYGDTHWIEVGLEIVLWEHTLDWHYTGLR